MLGLKLRRLHLGYSQTYVGDLSGISQSTMSLIEKGRWNPNAAELQQLARTLGLPLDDAPLLLTEFPDPLVRKPEPSEPEQAETVTVEQVQ